MAFTAVPSAGTKVRASVLSSLFSERTPLYAVLATGVPYTSNATPANVTDLVLAMLANHSYLFEAHMFASGGNNAGDVQYQFTYPTGCTVDIGGSGLHTSVTSGSSGIIETFSVVGDTTSPTTALGFAVSTTVTKATIWGRIAVGSTAGNLQLQASQAASNGTATNVLAGSFLRATMVL